MEYKELTKIMKRIHERGCANCPLSKINNGKCITYNDLIIYHPDEIERICLEWAKENPEITNRDKLFQIIKETFGVDVAEGIFLSFNFSGCHYMKCSGDCNNCPNEEFWDKPYIELKGDE